MVGERATDDGRRATSGWRLAGSEGSWNVVVASCQCCQVTDIVVIVVAVAVAFVTAVFVVVIGVAVVLVLGNCRLNFKF